MKKTVIFYLLLLILCSSCKEDNPKEPNKNGTIKGKVLSYRTMEPLSGVYITTVPPSSNSITNDSGNFVFEDVIPDTYVLNALKYGYYPNTATIEVQSGKTVQAYILLYDSVAMNHSPNIPELDSPHDGLKINSTTIQFSWSCSDPDNDPITYDLYLDTSIFVTKIIFKDLNQTKAEASNLQFGKTYYWKVIAKDKWGATSVSEIYSFIVDSTATPIDLSSLVLYFKFNNNLDNSANTNLSITDTNVTFVNDRKNNQNAAAYFDGNSSGITLKNNALLQLTSEFTIALWIKPETGYGNAYPSTGYVYILGMWFATGPGTSSYVLQVQAFSKTLEGSTYDGSTLSQCKTDKLVENEWSHVAFTFKDGISKIYINGQMVNSINAVAPQISTYDLFIGKTINNLSQFNGSMDELMIMRKALSDSDIVVLAK
jgi:hypothetical protein